MKVENLKRHKLYFPEETIRRTNQLLEDFESKISMRDLMILVENDWWSEIKKYVTKK